MQYEKFMETLREVLGNNNRVVSKAKLPNTVVRQFINVELDISFKDN